jgi:hypothetical protein
MMGALPATDQATTSSAVTSTTSATVTDSGVGGDSALTTDEEMPVSGAVNQTMLLVLVGLSVIGLGLTIRSLQHAELVQQD